MSDEDFSIVFVEIRKGQDQLNHNNRTKCNKKNGIERRVQMKKKMEANSFLPNTYIFYETGEKKKEKKSPLR